MLVDFWARYCGPCKVMEATVMTHPAVRRELARFVLFKVDVSEDTERDRDLQQRYRAHELPQLVLLDARGAELARAGKLGTAEQMLAFLRRAR